MSDPINFVSGGPAFKGHGMPGVDETWHRADEECDICRANAAKPPGPSYRVASVDHQNGTFTLTSDD